MIEPFKLPYHGTYPGEIPGQERLLSFPDKDHKVTSETLSILLGLFRAVYPETSDGSIYLHAYKNKAFTFVGIKDYAGAYVAVYRHDNSWNIITIPAVAYREWMDKFKYSYEVPDNLPRM